MPTSSFVNNSDLSSKAETNRESIVSDITKDGGVVTSTGRLSADPPSSNLVIDSNINNTENAQYSRSSEVAGKTNLKLRKTISFNHNYKPRPPESHPTTMTVCIVNKSF